jgi:hypothetical protein
MTLLISVGKRYNCHHRNHDVSRSLVNQSHTTPKKTHDTTPRNTVDTTPISTEDETPYSTELSHQAITQSQFNPAAALANIMTYASLIVIFMVAVVYCF